MLREFDMPAEQCSSLIPNRLPFTINYEGHTVLRNFDKPIHKVYKAVLPEQ